jgi:hypothetical protein
MRIDTSLGRVGVGEGNGMERVDPGIWGGGNSSSRCVGNSIWGVGNGIERVDTV